jgi:hypothetical protein
MALSVFPVGAVPTALAAASLQISQSTAGAGDPIVVAGHGFHPGDGVVIRVNFAAVGGSHPIQTSAAVNNAGNFQAAFTIRTAPCRRSTASRRRISIKTWHRSSLRSCV